MSWSQKDMFNAAQGFATIQLYINVYSFLLFQWNACPRTWATLNDIGSRCLQKWQRKTNCHTPVCNWKEKRSTKTAKRNRKHKTKWRSTERTASASEWKWNLTGMQLKFLTSQVITQRMFTHLDKDLCYMFDCLGLSQDRDLHCEEVQHNLCAWLAYPHHMKQCKFPTPAMPASSHSLRTWAEKQDMNTKESNRTRHEAVFWPMLESALFSGLVNLCQRTWAWVCVATLAVLAWARTSVSSVKRLNTISVPDLRTPTTRNSASFPFLPLLPEAVNWEHEDKKKLF